MKDRHGNPVELGDVVRVVEICQEFLDVLPEDELVHIEKMLNQEYPIDEFPEQGKASISISWEIEPGLTGHGGLYMLPHEFELVRKVGTVPSRQGWPGIGSGTISIPQKPMLASVRNPALLVKIATAFPACTAAFSDSFIEENPNLFELDVTVDLHLAVPTYMTWCATHDRLLWFRQKQSLEKQWSGNQFQKQIYGQRS